MYLKLFSTLVVGLLLIATLAEANNEFEEARLLRAFSHRRLAHSGRRRLPSKSKQTKTPNPEPSKQKRRNSRRASRRIYTERDEGTGDSMDVTKLVDQMQGQKKWRITNTHGALEPDIVDENQFESLEKRFRKLVDNVNKKKTDDISNFVGTLSFPEDLIKPLGIYHGTTTKKSQKNKIKRIDIIVENSLRDGRGMMYYVKMKVFMVKKRAPTYTTVLKSYWLEGEQTFPKNAKNVTGLLEKDEKKAVWTFKDAEHGKAILTFIPKNIKKKYRNKLEKRFDKLSVFLRFLAHDINGEYLTKGGHNKYVNWYRAQVEKKKKELAEQTDN